MRTLKEEYKKTINDFRDDVAELVKHKFMQDKVIHPVVFGLIIQGDKLIMTVLAGLGELFETEEGKERAAQVIRSMSKEIKPIALVFVSEGWMSSHATSEEILDENGKYISEAVRPANNPNRKEVLMLMFETFDEESHIFLEIKRIGELVELEDFQTGDWVPKSTTKPSGRFANMLQDNYSEINQILEKMLNKKETLN